MSWTSVRRRTRRARATRPSPSAVCGRGAGSTARRGAERRVAAFGVMRRARWSLPSIAVGRPTPQGGTPPCLARPARMDAPVPPTGQRSGTLPVTRVPSPGTASTASSPATAARRSSGSSSQACSAIRTSRPRVVVAHLEAQALVRPERDHDPGRLAADVGQRSDAGEVDRALDLRGVAPDAFVLDRAAQRRAPRGRAQRLDQPAVAEHRGVDAVGDGAHLVDRLVHLGAEQLELGRGLRRLVLEAFALQRELDAQRHEPLLGSVVHVALDPPSRLVGHGDDPGARCRQLPDRGGQPAHEPAVLEDHERVGRRGLQQRRVLRERGVGVDGRDPPPVHADLGEGPTLLLPGRLDAGRRLAHPAVEPVREPVGDLQRRILERVGQRRAQRLGRGLRLEAEGQPLQRRRGVEAPPQHARS